MDLLPQGPKGTNHWRKRCWLEMQKGLEKWERENQKAVEGQEGGSLCIIKRPQGLQTD